VVTLAILIVAGCVCTAIFEEDPTIDPPRDVDRQGELALEVVELDFGSVDLGQSTSRELVLNNVGDGDLFIQDLEIAPAAAAYSVRDLSSVLIAPGANANLQLAFEPVEPDTQAAWLTIRTSEVKVWSHRVSLSGEALGPQLTVDPVSVQLTDGVAGCEQQTGITLRNTGNEPLTIDGVQLDADSDELWLGGLPGLSLVIEPGLGTSLALHHLPLDAGDDAAWLWVGSDDPIAPELEIGIFATSPEGETVSETFVWEDPGGADVIIALDKTGKMSDTLSTTDTLMETVLALHGLEVDFQLALVVEDVGCTHNPSSYVTREHSEDEAFLLLYAMADAAAGGNHDRGFMLLEAALAETARGGCNEGLLRDGTRANLVGISDEPEQSVNSWSFYVTSFQAYHDDPDDVVVHAVGGDYPYGCEDADAYTGFYEATVATGGEFMSICSAWAEDLADAIAANQTGAYRILLPAAPIPGSIEVIVNGTTLDDGWIWSEDGGVTFDELTEPADGDVIEVTYTLAVECGA